MHALCILGRNTSVMVKMRRNLHAVKKWSTEMNELKSTERKTHFFRLFRSIFLPGCLKKCKKYGLIERNTETSYLVGKKFR